MRFNQGLGVSISPTRGAGIRFDDQAESFDQRAGLPQQACREIALRLSELTALETGDLLLDIGAGTGEIGAEIARLRTRYASLDLSLPMLRVFQRRLDGMPAPASLIVADANAGWPIADGCVRAIFGSRSFHLLSTDHLIQEALRVRSRRGALLVIGRVRRDSQAVKATMRREMLRLLGANAPGSNTGEGRSRLLIEALVARGAVALDPLVAARWTATHSAADSLNSWRSKPGLGGTSVPEPLKNEILSKLEKWAREAFQDLDLRVQSAEHYVLEGVRLPAA